MARWSWQYIVAMVWHRLVSAARALDVFSRLNRIERSAHGGRAAYIGNNRLLTRCVIGGTPLGFIVDADDRLLGPALFINGHHEQPATDYFIRHIGRRDYCLDIGANYGEPIYSPSNTSTVIAVGNQDNYCYKKGFGKYIAVKDPTNNLMLWFAHLGTIDVSPGQTISKGAEIGTVGATGLETGTHLHFSIFDANGFTMEVRDGCGPEPTGQDLDPLNYLGTTYR